jgi:hypothetical protein
MNGMTLKMLREALSVIRTSKRFAQYSAKNDGPNGPLVQLAMAEAYMLGNPEMKPERDPRDVLRDIGYGS